MSKIPYYQIDHYHCWDQEQPPACGLDKHTHCCLCAIPRLARMNIEGLFEKWKKDSESFYMSQEADASAKEAFLAGYEAGRNEAVDYIEWNGKAYQSVKDEEDKGFYASADVLEAARRGDKV